MSSGHGQSPVATQLCRFSRGDWHPRPCNTGAALYLPRVAVLYEMTAPTWLSDSLRRQACHDALCGISADIAVVVLRKGCICATQCERPLEGGFCVVQTVKGRLPGFLLRPQPQPTPFG